MTANEFIASLPAALVIGTQADGRYVSPADVVPAIRADLKAAIAAGVLPAGCKTSVRRDSYKSIQVEIVAWSGAVFCNEHECDLRHEMATGVSSSRSWRNHEQLHADLAAAIALIDRIADRHNYDHSDSMVDHFDVGYYLNVTAGAVEVLARRGIQLEANPAHAELITRAELAAKRLGPKATKAICGRRGVKGCGQWALESLLKLDARANGKPVAYDKSRRAWLVAA
jgi:hypothetical protein